MLRFFGVDQIESMGRTISDVNQSADPAGSCSDPRGHSGEGDSRERPDILYD